MGVLKKKDIYLEGQNGQKKGSGIRFACAHTEGL